MTTGKWIVQIRPLGEGAPEEPIYFQDFAATLAFVKEFKKRASDEIMIVRAPAEATDQQRQELVENGASLADADTSIGANILENIKKYLEEAKQDYDDLGGWEAFKSGEWLLLLIYRSFKNYWERATADYFCAKYPNCDKDEIAKRLIAVAAGNASVLGGITGAAVSGDEILTLLTGGGGVVGLPASIALAVTSISAEAILLVRFQLQLVANLGKLYGVPLDPEDPEDILTILAFAVGGGAAEAAGRAGMRMGGTAAGHAARNIFARETLRLVQGIGRQVGVNILQRSIVKYTVPVVSIAIGTGWNYFAMKAVGEIAIKHFKERAAITRPEEAAASDLGASTIAQPAGEPSTSDVLMARLATGAAQIGDSVANIADKTVNTFTEGFAGLFAREPSAPPPPPEAPKD